MGTKINFKLPMYKDYFFVKKVIQNKNNMLIHIEAGGFNKLINLFSLKYKGNLKERKLTMLLRSHLIKLEKDLFDPNSVYNSGR